MNQSKLNEVKLDITKSADDEEPQKLSKKVMLKEYIGILSDNLHFFDFEERKLGRLKG